MLKFSLNMNISVILHNLWFTDLTATHKSILREKLNTEKRVKKREGK